MIYNFNNDGTATLVLTEEEQEVLFYITTYWDAPPANSEHAAESDAKLVPAFDAWKTIPGVLNANARARHTPEAGVL